MMISVIAVLAILSILTSYSDIRYGKIWNLHIFGALIAGLVISFFLPNDAYVFIFMNLMIALFIGVIFWILGFWSPGDAKLYIVYSFLVSLLFYRPLNFEDYPFLMVLVYTFFPFFVVFLLYAVLKAGIAKIVESFITSLKARRLLETALMVFAIEWAATVLPMNNFFFSLFLIMAVFAIVKRIFELDNIMFLVIIGALRLLLDDGVVSSAFFLRFILLVIMVTILRYVSVDISFKVFSRRKKLSDLIPGDLPAEIIIREGDEYRRVKMPRFGMDRTGDKLISQRPEGISQSEIEGLMKAKMRYKTLRVFDMMPFAPFMGIGVIIILILSYM